MSAAAIRNETQRVVRGEVHLPDSVVDLYVVGQLHGAPDALRAIDERIARDSASRDPGAAAVLHAGGYIDKGNQVPELLDRLVRRGDVSGVPVTYLLGAHEWLMSRTLDGDRRAALKWLLSGAEASLDRWRVPTEDWISALTGIVPGNVSAFLRGLPVCAWTGRQAFACGTFADGPARPFGLLTDLAMPHGLVAGRFTPIDNFTSIARHETAVPWAVRDRWAVNGIVCEALVRNPEGVDLA